MDRFWTTIMPVCLVEAKDKKLADLLRSSGYTDSFADAVRAMDGAEFNLFLSKVVITASGQGVVGAALTEKVTFLKELRIGQLPNTA